MWWHQIGEVVGALVLFAPLKVSGICWPEVGVRLYICKSDNGDVAVLSRARGARPISARDHANIPARGLWLRLCASRGGQSTTKNLGFSFSMNKLNLAITVRWAIGNWSVAVLKLVT